MYSGMADILKKGTVRNSTETVVIDDDFKFGFKREDMKSRNLCGSIGMADISKNDTVDNSTETMVIDDDFKFGFKRQDMKSVNLCGSIGMADISENDTVDNSTETMVIDDDVKFGFKRRDMYFEYLCGSVRPYGRHVFLCYEDWTAYVASFEPDMLYGHLARAMKERCNDFAVPTLLAICDGGHGTGLSDGDVLIFPEMINYRGLKKSNIKRFVEEVIVEGKPWSSGKQKEVTGTYVFVCAHSKNPDKRCDVCGPAIIDKFKEEIEVRALKDKVFVIPYFCSGIHRHAGHLVIYSKLKDGKVIGHWYGYVTPADVADLLDLHIKKGKFIERIWRGKIGVHPLLLKGRKAVIQMQPSENGLKVSEKENNKDVGCYKFESPGAKKSMHKTITVVGVVATVAVVAWLITWINCRC